MVKSKQPVNDIDEVQSFYNSVYYKDAKANKKQSSHLSRLASKMKIKADIDVVDVACGKGEWLLAVSERGGNIAGIDLSFKAINVCKTVLPDGEFYIGTAETLPFEDKRFHIVSCLGAIEHFLDPQTALKEMVRIARDDATFLLLVPNKDFLTRRLGLFGGTAQADIREEVRTLQEWKELFEEAGLQIEKRWKDLHVLSWAWITSKRWYNTPLRAVQAFALLLWPISWQYQVYYLCVKRNSIDR